ncbi:hypothetical protein [Aurantiacibacter gilvus]|uniref:DUF1579 domain-containing protein n=1 Tax=Aurantiacibacter gilvus TaxID=3139141 RepID=A0ABU9IGD8_9SPHN
MMKSLMAAAMLLPGAAGMPAAAQNSEQDAGPVGPASQFAMLAELQGEWTVDQTEQLRIVFEVTAGGTTVMERWMVGERTHSLTLYHLDGARLVATHYCPQGNQPRLEAQADGEGGIDFGFASATDLDSSESYQHDLHIAPQADGSVVRSEVYFGPDGPGDPSALILRRAG